MVVAERVYEIIAESAKKRIIEVLVRDPYAIYTKNFETDFLRSLQKHKQKPQDIYTAENLLLHLYDEPWLKKYIAAFYLQKNLGQYVNENAVKYYAINRQFLVNQYLNFNNIGKFVEDIYHNELFQKKLNQYQELLVYAQIKDLQNHSAANNFHQIKDYDIAFRSKIISEMRNLEIGMPLLEAEKLVEKKKFWWYKDALQQTYENTYYPQHVIDFIKLKSARYQERIAKMKTEHYDAWEEKREVAYFNQFIQGKPELEAMYTGCRSLSYHNLQKLDYYEKRYRKLVNNDCQNQKKLSKLNHKPLSLYIGFRAKEIVDNAKKRKLLNSLPSTSWGYIYAVGKRKKIGLSEIFHHNDSEWEKYKETKMNELPPTNPNNEKSK